MVELTLLQKRMMKDKDVILSLIAEGKGAKAIAATLKYNPHSLQLFIDKHLAKEVDAVLTLQATRAEKDKDTKKTTKKSIKLDNVVIPEGTDTKQLIELTKQRAKQLLSIKIGDRIDIGEEEEIIVDVNKAAKYWQQGQQILTSAINEETKIIQVEKDLTKNTSDLKLDVVLLALQQNTEPLEAARARAINEQKLLKAKYAKFNILDEK